LGYDTVWGYAGRPDWIANARSYEFVDASSRSLATMVAERRKRLAAGEEADETPAP
jgi:membrane protein required for colicin V production